VEADLLSLIKEELSMNSILPSAARHAVRLAAGLACGAAAAIDMAPEAVSGLDSSVLKAAYLECDRLSSRTAMDQHFMITCGTVSDVLLHREFAGNLERQLQWWKGAREDFLRMREFMPSQADVER
jgi:hypothetical protein